VKTLLRWVVRDAKRLGETMPVKQSHVFAAIGRERAKQDRDCSAPFSLDDELDFIYQIVRVEASTLNVLRIAALAVRCLENHGLPSDPEDTGEIPLEGEESK